MITSPPQPPKKVKPAHWRIADIHSKLDTGIFVFSISAQRDYTNLGMDRKGAGALIRELTNVHFEWCYKYPDGVVHDSYKAHVGWYDENAECEQSAEIFVKLCINDKGWLVIERFHLDGRL